MVFDARVVITVLVALASAVTIAFVGMPASPTRRRTVFGGVVLATIAIGVGDYLLQSPRETPLALYLLIVLAAPIVTIAASAGVYRLHGNRGTIAAIGTAVWLAAYWLSIHLFLTISAMM